MKSIFIAVAFSLFYLFLYPILRGGSSVYHYPYWPPPLAAMYVAGGILLQAWFCFGRKRPATGHMLLAQVVAGVLYTAAISVFPGSIYQS